jgi:hypothetical protein
MDNRSEYKQAYQNEESSFIEQMSSSSTDVDRTARHFRDWRLAYLLVVFPISILSLIAMGILFIPLSGNPSQQLSNTNINLSSGPQKISYQFEVVE